jgi:NAD(P)-dependent dehydrogenase (short-subunit alcohol dehydrogenase family)
MTGRLADKVALVTGSTSGIGQAIAERFAAEGARVVVTGRRQERGEAVVSRIRAAGGEARFVQADFENSAEVRRVVGFALDAYGALDVLVNNAMSHAVSWGDGKTVVDLAEAEWERMLAVGLTAAFVACQEAIPAMVRRGGGAIVTIGSIRSFLGARKGFAYDVIKSGLVNLSRQINVDFGRQGIRSNLLCPGWVISDPERADRLETDPDLRAKARIFQTVGRAGRPADVANAALFLASEESSFVAGAVLVVDGGLTVSSHFEIQPELEEFYRGRFAGQHSSDTTTRSTAS